MIRAWLSPTVLALALLAALGCGPEEPRDPKKALTEKEQEQIKSFQQQRDQEWGGPKKK